MIRRIMFWSCVILLIGWVSKNPGSASNMASQLAGAMKSIANAAGVFVTRLTA